MDLINRMSFAFPFKYSSFPLDSFLSLSLFNEKSSLDHFVKGNLLSIDNERVLFYKRSTEQSVDFKVILDMLKVTMHIIIMFNYYWYLGISREVKIYRWKTWKHKRKRVSNRLCLDAIILKCSLRKLVEKKPFLIFYLSNKLYILFSEFQPKKY